MVHHGTIGLSVVERPRNTKAGSFGIERAASRVLDAIALRLVCTLDGERLDAITNAKSPGRNAKIASLKNIGVSVWPNLHVD